MRSNELRMRFIKQLIVLLRNNFFVNELISHIYFQDYLVKSFYSLNRRAGVITSRCLRFKNEIHRLRNANKNCKIKIIMFLLFL